MRKFLLLLLLVSFISGFSQPASKTDDGKINQGLITNDSTLAGLKHLDDSLQQESRKKEELKEIERLSQQSIGYFVQLQKERRAKEKRNAMIRIGIGVAFFILLIFGLRRRVKK